jgi:hypothetical protein
LVIKDETDMITLLEFLIISLESIDGKRGTAIPKILAFKDYDNLFDEKNILTKNDV